MHCAVTGFVDWQFSLKEIQRQMELLARSSSGKIAIRVFSFSMYVFCCLPEHDQII